MAKSKSRSKNNPSLPALDPRAGPFLPQDPASCANPPPPPPPPPFAAPLPPPPATPPHLPQLHQIWDGHAFRPVGFPGYAYPTPMCKAFRSESRRLSQQPLATATPSTPRRPGSGGPEQFHRLMQEQYQHPMQSLFVPGMQDQFSPQYAPPIYPTMALQYPHMIPGQYPPPQQMWIPSSSYGTPHTQQQPWPPTHHQPAFGSPAMTPLEGSPRVLPGLAWEAARVTHDDPNYDAICKLNIGANAVNGRSKVAAWVKNVPDPLGEHEDEKQPKSQSTKKKRTKPGQDEHYEEKMERWMRMEADEFVPGQLQ